MNLGMSMGVWFLFKITGKCELVVAEFEALLNNQSTTERDLQRFFVLHPEFLLRDEYDNYWSEPVLTSPQGQTIRPDFVLQPRGLQAVWNWALVDLKGPRVPVLNDGRFHKDLSRHVYRVATQLRDHGDFFEDSRNANILKRRFGGAIPHPQLVAVIGRVPTTTSHDRYAKLRSRVTGVTITTYDEILELRRAKVEQSKLLWS